MKITIVSISVFILCAFPLTLVHGQDSVVYPAKGQSQGQMEKDKGNCSTWAKKETGVDPAVLAQESTEQPAQTGPKGERLRGAARGAGAGAIVGGIGGNAGKGAAIGAGAGAVAGGARQRGKAEAQQENEQQQKTATKESLEKYNRAYAACLEGKGYTVK